MTPAQISKVVYSRGGRFRTPGGGDLTASPEAMTPMLRRQIMAHRDEILALLAVRDVTGPWEQDVTRLLHEHLQPPGAPPIAEKEGNS